MEGGVLQWFYSLSGSEWTVNSEKNILVEVIKGTIYKLELNISFSNGKTWNWMWIKDVTGLCQKITPGEYSSGYPEL